MDFTWFHLTATSSLCLLASAPPSTVSQWLPVSCCSNWVKYSKSSDDLQSHGVGYLALSPCRSCSLHVTTASSCPDRKKTPTVTNGSFPLCVSLNQTLILSPLFSGNPALSLPLSSFSFTGCRKLCLQKSALCSLLRKWAEVVLDWLPVNWASPKELLELWVLHWAESSVESVWQRGAFASGFGPWSVPLHCPTAFICFWHTINRKTYGG